MYYLNCFVFLVGMGFILFGDQKTEHEGHFKWYQTKDIKNKLPILLPLHLHYRKKLSHNDLSKLQMGHLTQSKIYQLNFRNAYCEQPFLLCAILYMRSTHGNRSLQRTICQRAISKEYMLQVKTKEESKECLPTIKFVLIHTFSNEYRICLFDSYWHK